jgi:hypothetical protein
MNPGRETQSLSLWAVLRIESSQSNTKHKKSLAKRRHNDRSADGTFSCPECLS